MSSVVCPVVRPTTDQLSEPIVKTTKPQPVTRALRLDAVMIAAIAVAIGALHPAKVSKFPHDDPFGPGGPALAGE